MYRTDRGCVLKSCRPVLYRPVKLLQIQRRNLNTSYGEYCYKIIFMLCSIYPWEEVLNLEILQSSE